MNFILFIQGDEITENQIVNGLDIELDNNDHDNNHDGLITDEDYNTMLYRVTKNSWPKEFTDRNERRKLHRVIETK